MRFIKLTSAYGTRFNRDTQKWSTEHNSSEYVMYDMIIGVNIQNVEQLCVPDSEAFYYKPENYVEYPAYMVKLINNTQLYVLESPEEIDRLITEAKAK